jgi:flagellar hook-associated protein 2
MTVSNSSPLPVRGSTSSLASVTTGATTSLLSQNPAIKAIDAQIVRDNTRLSTLGKMALALDQFQHAVGNLTIGGLDLAATSTTKTADARVLSAGAATGVHTVEVRQLASAQQLVSKGLPDRNLALGGGGATVIKLASGSSSVTVNIGSGNNTLDGVAKAMRDAGVDAQVVQDGKGFALRLTGKTGAANGMRIDVSGDPVLRGLLSYGAGGASAMTQQSAPQDAQLIVDGKPMSASSNSTDTAIAGVSLALKAVGKTEVSVARNPSAIATKVKDFVAAFNTLNGQLGALRTGDASADTALNQVVGQMGQALDGADTKLLAEMGITRKNGGLALDEAKLKTAVAADPERVGSLFGKPDTGLLERLAKRAGQQIASGSAIARQAASVKQEIDKLSEKKEKAGEAIGRQAALLAQQYGNGQVKPMSLFDFLA